MASQALKLKREEHAHEILKSVLDTTTQAAASPIGLMLIGTLVNQKLYNVGAFNPHDPNHTEREDWEAGAAVSDWLFFATMTVAACQAAGAAADVLPSISDFV